jgi:hypothetical protein
VDKLLSIASLGEDHVPANSDPMTFKPRPAAMGTRRGGKGMEDDEEEDGVYKAARLASVAYDGDEKETLRRRKELEKKQRKAASGSIISHLRDELYSDRPEVLHCVARLPRYL